MNDRMREIKEHHADTDAFLLKRVGVKGPLCHEDRGYLLSRVRALEELVGKKESLSSIRAEVWEEAALEAEKERPMFLTKENVADGMLDEYHPVIIAREVMRSEIAKALRKRALALRVEDEPSGKGEKP